MRKKTPLRVCLVRLVRSITMKIRQPIATLAVPGDLATHPVRRHATFAMQAATRLFKQPPALPVPLVILTTIGMQQLYVSSAQPVPSLTLVQRPATLVRTGFCPSLVHPRAPIYRCRLARSRWKTQLGPRPA